MHWLACMASKYALCECIISIKEILTKCVWMHVTLTYMQTVALQMLQDTLTSP